MFIGSCSGVFRALDRATGDLRWSFETGETGDPPEYHGDPLVAEDVVVTGFDRTLRNETIALGMDDGSAIRLTTAKYYTPSEQVIHDHGIAPNIYVPMSRHTWEKLLGARSLASAEDGLDAPSGDPEVVDVQLERAVDVLKGVKVFEARSRGDIHVARASIEAADVEATP